METALIVSSVLLWLVVLCNVLLTLALIRRINANAPTPQGLPAGTPAPAFTAETLNGETATLATYTGRGRNVALLFISTHCTPCREILGTLKGQAAAATLAGTEVVIISGDQREETEALIAEMELDAPFVLAPRGQNTCFADYHISATPSFCLLNHRGNVQACGIPSTQHGEWKALIDTWTTAEATLAGERG